MRTLHVLLRVSVLLVLLQASPAQPASSARPASSAQVAPAQAAPAAAALNGDTAIGQRLEARLRTISGLKDVRANVIEGVVTLEGEVVSEDQRKLAEVIAAQTRGVTQVDSRIVLSSRLKDRFAVALDVAGEKLVRLAAAAPLLLVAVLIVFLSVRAGRLIARRPSWLRRVKTSNPYMEGLVERIVQWLIALAGVLLALDLMGATSLVGAVLGSAGLVGLVVGFAFKDIAENYVAGILLSLRRPFSPGDHLVIDRLHEGKVVALTSRATLLMTLDGNQISLPNALVFKSVVLNYTQNPKRRFDFLIPLDPSSSVGDAQRAGLAAVAGVDGVLADPAPYALVHEYLPDRLSLQYLGWVDQTRNSHVRVRSEAMRAAKSALDDAGIRRAGVSADRVAQRSRVAVPADTSVDHDIDEQLAQAQRESDPDNMLDAGRRAKQQA